MSNHYHVVLRVDRSRVRRWTDEEVIQRWIQLFRGPLLVQRLHGRSTNRSTEQNCRRDSRRVAHPAVRYRLVYALLAFSGDRQEHTEPGCLPFTLRDYVALVEATGPCVRSDKHGIIPASARSALDQLSLSDETWLRLALEIQASALQAVGAMARLRRYGAASGRRWIRGSGELARVYNAA